MDWHDVSCRKATYQLRRFMMYYVKAPLIKISILEIDFFVFFNRHVWDICGPYLLSETPYIVKRALRTISSKYSPFFSKYWKYPHKVYSTILNDLYLKTWGWILILFTLVETLCHSRTSAEAIWISTVIIGIKHCAPPPLHAHIMWCLKWLLLTSFAILKESSL